MPLLPNPQTPSGGTAIYPSFLRPIIAGTHNSLIRVPVKWSSTSSLLSCRMLVKISSEMLVPVKVRRLSLLSPASNVHDPFNERLLKKSTVMSLFELVNKDVS